MSKKLTSKELQSGVKEALVALHTGAETGKKVTNRDAEFAIKAVTTTLFDALASGKNAGLYGLGTIELRERAERKGRNPQTGEDITISARTGLGLNPSDGLKQAVKDIQISE